MTSSHPFFGNQYDDDAENTHPEASKLFPSSHPQVATRGTGTLIFDVHKGLIPSYTSTYTLLCIKVYSRRRQLEAIRAGVLEVLDITMGQMISSLEDLTRTSRHGEEVI